MQRFFRTWSAWCRRARLRAMRTIICRPTLPINYLYPWGSSDSPTPTPASARVVQMDGVMGGRSIKKVRSILLFLIMIPIKVDWFYVWCQKILTAFGYGLSIMFETWSGGGQNYEINICSLIFTFTVKTLVIWDCILEFFARSTLISNRKKVITDTRWLEKYWSPK